MDQVTNEETERKHPNKPLGVLVLSQTCPPDVGGVQTHVLALVSALKDHPDYRTWIVAKVSSNDCQTGTRMSPTML